MSYYVSLTNSTFTIKKDKLDDAYRAMCALNDIPGIKRGERYPRDESEPEPNENTWFSWMPWNYPSVYKSAMEIFTALGFHAVIEDAGLMLVGYEDKAGQERLFIEAVAPYSTGFLEWRGEDGSMWREEVVDGAIVERSATIIWS